MHENKRLSFLNGHQAVRTRPPSKSIFVIKLPSCIILYRVQSYIVTTTYSVTEDDDRFGH